MTSQRHRLANSRNGARFLGPVSAKGKCRSSQNIRLHGLSLADGVPVVHALKSTLIADAEARGFDAFATEELVSSNSRVIKSCGKN